MSPRYEPREITARSDGGTVLRAFDTHSEREVFIKRARANGGEELVREAAILRRMSHPNIVACLDSGRDEQGEWLVMERAGERTLESLMLEGPLSWKAFESLVEQTLAGVAAAHSCGVLHLDLKPQNIMVTGRADGPLRVKLLDFGVAQARMSPADPPCGAVAGPVMGSLYFMAPERFERRLPDERADLYSLGCIFHQALTGRLPFDGHTGAEVMVAHLRHQRGPFDGIHAGVPGFVSGWIGWLLSRRPEDRPASAAGALAAFREQRATAGR